MTSYQTSDSFFNKIKVAINDNANIYHTALLITFYNNINIFKGNVWAAITQLMCS